MNPDPQASTMQEPNVGTGILQNQLAQPTQESPAQKQEKVAKRVNHFLQEKWQHWNIRNILDEVVLNALLFNVSYMVVGFDSQVGDIFIDPKDAFDVYMPTHVSDIEDSPFVIITYLKTKQDIESNPRYKNTDQVIYGNKRAQSEYKELRINDKFGEHNSNYEETKTVILKRAYFKIKDKKGTRIEVYTTAGGQLLLKETIDQSQYPIVMYKPLPGEIYQPSWIEKYISLNKSLDVFVSQMENFMNTMVRGRWSKQRGNNVSRMTNQDGEWIEYDSAPPEMLEIPQMPNFPFIHMQNLEKWVEEQGVSTSALGKAPKGIRAYKAIESLKNSDFANLRIPVANLQDTLQKLTEKVLDLADKYYLTPQTIHRSENEHGDSFRVIGQTGANLAINQPEMQGPNPPVILKGSYRVKAVVDSGLSYTEEGKRDTLTQLFQAGIIDKRTLMEGFKFSNISEILDAAANETDVSMVETPDFQILPDPMKQIILQYLSEPAIAQTNPIAQSQKIKAQRKSGNKSFKKS